MLLVCVGMLLMLCIMFCGCWNSGWVGGLFVLWLSLLKVVLCILMWLMVLLVGRVRLSCWLFLM